MESQSRLWDSSQEAGLEYAWGEYRTWAATSRAAKKRVTDWRFRVLILTIAGAVLATLGGQLAASAWLAGWLRLAPGVAAGAALALAAYFSREVLGDAQIKAWLRARSTAEALKTETFLFRAGVPPYDGLDDAERLRQAVDKIHRNVQDLSAVILTKEKKKDGLPAGSLSVHKYIEERVDDQVDGYYLPTAAKHERAARRIRTISLWLGAVAAVLGVLSTTTATGWVAVITTIMAVLAAYLYAERFQFLIVSYQATARRLTSLKTKWRVSGKTEADTSESAQFIRDCEETISVENSAWMAKLPEKNPDQSQL